MGIYERFGVKPIINAFGTMTLFGSSLMEIEALSAMEEASKQSVRLDELQAAASRVIAEKTHAEAGIVTCGASAALTLGTAACICKLDVALMNRLPFTEGIPNEVIMPWPHISGYAHAIKAAGAKIIGVGTPISPSPPNKPYVIKKWDIESAITERTVAISYLARVGANPPLQDIIDISKEYNIPTLIDAATQVPPLDNLYRFIDMGADLVCFSGGKGIRGPQASGILCGRYELIASAILQNLDMGVEPFDNWNPPSSLIPKDRLRSKPDHGIGRGAKATKEAIIGLLVALQKLTEEGFERKANYLTDLLKVIATKVESIPGIELWMTEDYPGAYPMLAVRIDEKIVGKSAFDIANKLKSNRVYIRDHELANGILFINSLNFDDEVASSIAKALYDTINDITQ